MIRWRKIEFVRCARPVSRNAADAKAEHMRACVFRPASSPVGSSVTTNMLFFHAPSPGLAGEGADRRTRGPYAPRGRALLFRLMVCYSNCWLAKLIFAVSALTVAFAPAAE